MNRRPILGEELERLYELDFYWHMKQRADGMPPIEDRRSVDEGDGRVARWLDLVEEHLPGPGVAIEIGCSHGLMLESLASRGWTCVGVEVDPALAAKTSATIGVDVRAGVFPGPDLPACDLFMAFDVLEHSADPLAFMVEARRLLRSGGIAIVQAPIDRYGGEPPFNGRFNDAFDDIEHLFVFTDRAIELLAARSGFEVVSADQRLWLLGEIAVLKASEEVV